MKSREALNRTSNSESLKTLLMIFLLTSVGFYFIGPFLGMLIALPFYGFDFEHVIQIVSDPVNNPDSKPALYLVQAITTAVAFIVIPWWYAKFRLGRSLGSLFNYTVPSPGIASLTMILVIVFMGFNSIFIDFNASIDLPESFGALKRFVNALHESYESAARFLTTFEDPYEIWAAVLVIAILPAIGEELVFRGFIQGSIIKMTPNPHLGIWITGLLFGLFHLDFYGLIPRTILGALFGYLMFWSGSITYPILAHFANNAFTLLMIYLYRKGAINIDIESTESISFINVLVSFVLSAALIYIFRRRFNQTTD